MDNTRLTNQIYSLLDQFVHILPNGEVGKELNVAIPLNLLISE